MTSFGLYAGAKMQSPSVALSSALCWRPQDEFPEVILFAADKMDGRVPQQGSLQSHRGITLH